MQNLTKTGAFGTAQYVRDLTGIMGPSNLIVTQQLGPNPWHFCSKTQFVVTLAGSWFVNTTDGGHVVMNPGDVLFQDDSAENPAKGKHFSGSIGGPCNQLVLQVKKAPVVGDFTCDWVHSLVSGEQVLV